MPPQIQKAVAPLCRRLTRDVKLAFEHIQQGGRDDVHNVIADVLSAIHEHTRLKYDLYDVGDVRDKVET